VNDSEYLPQMFIINGHIIIFK